METFMKRSFGLGALWGFAVTSLLGTLLHFLYDWLGRAPWIAPVSAVNESTFEHMKLLFVPMLLYTAVQSRFFRDRTDFFCVKLKSILLGLLLIPVLFYTYNGAIGKSPDPVNIAIFFISAAIASIYEVRAFKSRTAVCRHPRLAVAILLVTAALFGLFTFFPPEIGLFRDPLTGTYGL
jgi:hypothetical protein